MLEPCIQTPFPQLRLIMQKVHLSNSLNFSRAFSVFVHFVISEASINGVADVKLEIVVFKLF